MRFFSLLSVLFFIEIYSLSAVAQDYQVLPPEPLARGQIWIGEGASYVQAENRAVENRFRLGLGMFQVICSFPAWDSAFSA